MKMTLNQKQWLCIGMMAFGIFLLLLANAAENGKQILVITGCLCVMGGLVLHFKLVRCPHCKEWVGKHPGEYCRHCGEKLDWT